MSMGQSRVQAGNGAINLDYKKANLKSKLAFNISFYLNANVANVLPMYGVYCRHGYKNNVQ